LPLPKRKLHNIILQATGIRFCMFLIKPTFQALVQMVMGSLLTLKCRLILFEALNQEPAWLATNSAAKEPASFNHRLESLVVRSMHGNEDYSQARLVGK